jgi:hypothetical protein
MIIICNSCKREFQTDNDKKKYCCMKCKSKEEYRRNKLRYIKNANNWNLANPEKRKSINKKSFKKFISEKPDRFKELMKKNYYNSKHKWNCRALTYRLIINNRVHLNKECNICHSKEDLEIHHEVYPMKTKEIKDAIRERKIYFLCHKHHLLTRKIK